MLENTFISIKKKSLRSAAQREKKGKISQPGSQPHGGWKTSEKG